MLEKYKEGLVTTLQKGLLIAGVAGLFLFWFMGYVNQERRADRVTKESDLMTISGVLAHDLSIETASEGSAWVELRLEEYPQCNFQLDNYVYQAARIRDLIREVHKGDSIWIRILRFDFQAKLAGLGTSRQLEVGEEKKIYPYELRTKEVTYLRLMDLNEAVRDGRNALPYLVLPMTLILALLAFFEVTPYGEKLRVWLDRLNGLPHR